MTNPEVLNYGFAVIANNVSASFTYDRISSTEKKVIATSVILGIDAIVTPGLSGGKTLHGMLLESVGLSLPELFDHYTTIVERALAAGGQIYHSLKNAGIGYDIFKEQFNL